ncbi:MAG: glycosyltransferase family 39 protein, partial [Alistipes sp.]|nr:glycosyltransferase family 39 protein [Alistipes sp.]
MSALYVYMCAFLIKFFGMETFVFRIPAVIFSAVTIIFSSLIVKRAYGKNWALVNAFLFCLLPYFTMQSRFGLDCNIMLGAACVCIYMTMLAIEKNKTWFYLLTGCFWGIAFYTYVLSYIIFSV